MAFKSIFLLVVIFILSACEESNDPEAVQLRVRNVSQHDYTGVVVSTGCCSHDFGDIPAGEVSEYEMYESAYRYGFVQLMVGEETFTLQPIDYVGESYLESGSYTYEIDTYGNESQVSSITLQLAKK